MTRKMNNYIKGILYLIFTRPKKILALYRIATGSKRFARKNFMREDYLSTPPVTVAIRSTYRCNLRCVQCGQWGIKGALRNASKEFLQKELTTDQIKSFISEIAWFRPYLFFTGGEPLLRDDIFQLIRFADSKNLLTSISTNCTLLESNAHDLVASRLDYLFASYDGPPKIDDKIRLGENSCQRALKGIKAVIKERKRLKARLPLIQVQFTLTRENQHFIYDTAKFLEEELKVDTFGVVPGVFTTEELNKATSEIYRKEFGIEQKYWEGFIRDVSGMDVKTIGEQIERIKNEKWSFRFRPYPPVGYKDFSFSEYFDNPKKIFGGVFCSTPYVFTQLQPNGDIATCGSQPDYIAGNILSNKFMDIWNGEKYRAFRAFTRKHLFPSCPRCWALYEFYRK